MLDKLRDWGIEGFRNLKSEFRFNLIPKFLNSSIP
jgi:hypothetical protein